MGRGRDLCRPEESVRLNEVTVHCEAEPTWSPMVPDKEIDVTSHQSGV